MRRKIEAVVRDEFRTLAIRMRDDLDLTQDQMSEALFMSERSYSDIENGHSTCGTVTAMLMLSKVDDPLDFLRHMNLRFEEMGIGTREKMKL